MKCKDCPYHINHICTCTNSYCYLHNTDDNGTCIWMQDVDTKGEQIMEDLFIYTINSKIVEAIHENGFAVTARLYDGFQFQSTVSYKKHPELSFHIYVDYDINLNYNYLMNLIKAITNINMNEVMKDIIRWWPVNEFSLDKAVELKEQLDSDVLSLYKALYDIKHWMDCDNGTGTRKIYYKVKIEATINERFCESMLDLTEDEQAVIKKDIDRLFTEGKYISVSGKFENESVKDINPE